MITEKMQQLLNDQIRKEFYSAYLYLSMEAYFLSIGLDGFANWFQVQTQEERDHAMMFYNYIDHVGGSISLQKIDAPPVKFESVEEVLKRTLEHEQLVTQSIYNIVNLAIEEKDHKTNSFLQWFVTEQAEEENNAEKNLRKLRLVSSDSKALLMLDAEMAQRVYATPVNPALPPKNGGQI